MNILGSILKIYLDYAHVRNLDVESLLEGIDFSERDFADTSLTVSSKDFCEILKRISLVLEKDRLGIRIGNFVQLSSLGLIYQISLQATTVEEAVYYLKHFLEMAFPLVQIQTKLKQEDGVIELNTGKQHPVLDRIILESLLIIISRELQLMSHQSTAFKFTSPFYNANYSSNFSFGNTYSLQFSGLRLQAALRSFDQEQLDYLIPQYLQMIEGLKQEEGFHTKVKITALNMAKPELPGLGEIADTFHLSPRTFQRRLAKERLSFRKIIDELKKEIAVLLLQHKPYSIGDISYILGYSESAAFIHSFKKWYGQTPTNLRAKA